MELELVRKYGFEAARWLPLLADGHPCRRLHGHSFRAEVRLRGPLNPATGFILDYADLDSIAGPVFQQLDHACLNDLGHALNAPLLQNPTTEHIALWLAQQLHPSLPNLHSLAVWETETAGAVVYAEPSQ
jgi:6-pyruvoyltetrahydropterin/6-carboxytetrahydropterin synthase